MKTNNLLRFVSFIIVLTLFGSSFKSHAQSSKQPFIIMIDPGHGGKDTGTPGTGRYKSTEKDIALDVSLALGEKLNSIPNVKVLYTRSKDVFPELWERSDIANKKEANLFISIHCNAQPGKKGTAYGSETFVLGLHKEAVNLEVVKRENSVIFLEDNYEENYKGFDPNSPESLLPFILMQEEYLDQSIALAKNIEDEFKVTAKRRSRGVKQAGFYVLAKTSMPSVLVELGFLTHRNEEDFLNSRKGKQLMTSSLYKAIVKYIKNHQIDSEFVSYENPSSPDVSGTASENIKLNDITFKVQIAASSKALETKPYNFNGLNSVARIKEGNLYKYYYGNTENYETSKNLVSQAKEKGYKSSFVVAFKDGEKIELTEALKSISN